jgi:UDPglucose--hexose-1-phosphate uridylyltransferase
MAKYVPDVKTQRWVIIAQSRSQRPSDIEEKPVGEEKKGCPFCPGNETLTPPEVYRIGSGGKDAPGWEVRVVPNKFPITDIHEVIIHGPSCTDDIEELPLEHVTKIFTAYRDRYRANEKDGQVMIFCNHGIAAGASLKHPHSQVVVVPNQINLDALSLEPVNNIVVENDHFITYCPDFSQWPFEVWIAPKVRGKHFSEVADAELPDLAGVVKDTLKRIQTALSDPEQGFVREGENFVYNYYIYHGTDWFLRVTPRAVYRAGFELGTGLSVNVMDPTMAAEWLKRGKLEGS